MYVLFQRMIARVCLRPSLISASSLCAIASASRAVSRLRFGNVRPQSLQLAQRIGSQLLVDVAQLIKRVKNLSEQALEGILFACPADGNVRFCKTCHRMLVTLSFNLNGNRAKEYVPVFIE